jgi:hypothetical protein
MAQQTETGQVFHTGRNLRTLSWMLACAFLVVLPLHISGIGRDPGAALDAANAGWLVPVVGGAVLLVVELLVYVRSTLRVTDDGVVFRNWRGRVTSIPWERLREVVVRAQRATGSSRQGAITIASSLGPRNIITAWLVYTAEYGDQVRLKVTTDSSFKRVNEMAELLAERAGLERSDDFSDLDRVWSRS